MAKKASTPRREAATHATQSPAAGRRKTSRATAPVAKPSSPITKEQITQAVKAAIIPNSLKMPQSAALDELWSVCLCYQTNARNDPRRSILARSTSRAAKLAEMLERECFTIGNTLESFHTEPCPDDPNDEFLNLTYFGDSDDTSVLARRYEMLEGTIGKCQELQDFELFKIKFSIGLDIWTNIALPIAKAFNSAVATSNPEPGLSRIAPRFLSLIFPHITGHDLKPGNIKNSFFTKRGKADPNKGKPGGRKVKA